MYLRFEKVGDALVGAVGAVGAVGDLVGTIVGANVGGLVQIGSSTVPTSQYSLSGVQMMDFDESLPHGPASGNKSRTIDYPGPWCNTRA